LSKILGENYSGCDQGIFTDTANYVDLIGECTNISVGYQGAHTEKESQDCFFLMSLAKTLIAADWSTLVFERKPGEIDPEDRFWGAYGGSSWTGHYGNANDYWKNKSKYSWDNIYNGLNKPDDACDYREDYENPSIDMVEFVEENPMIVSMFLEECGYNIDDLRKYAKDFK